MATSVPPRSVSVGVLLEYFVSIKYMLIFHVYIASLVIQV